MTLQINHSFMNFFLMENFFWEFSDSCFTWTVLFARLLAWFYSYDLLFTFLMYFVLLTLWKTEIKLIVWVLLRLLYLLLFGRLRDGLIVLWLWKLNKINYFLLFVFLDTLYKLGVQPILLIFSWLEWMLIYFQHSLCIKNMISTLIFWMSLLSAYL